MGAKRMTAKELGFIEHYMKTRQASESYLAAGYSDHGKQKNTVKASELLRRPRIAEEILKRDLERKKRTGITEDVVVRRLWQIATADPANIVRVKVSNCRHCWGSEFKYQYTDQEWEAQVEEAERLDLPEPPKAGGVGFTLNRPPHPDCPSCGGVGKSKLIVADTNSLDPQSRLLYAGAEPGRYGIKVKMHDQMQALVKVAEHLGMFESKTVEKIRQATLAKLAAEADEAGKDITPVQVNINVVDASRPDRERG